MCDTIFRGGRLQVDGMYLYPLTEYCIYLYILRYGVQEVKENVCLFRILRGGKSFFCVCCFEGGGRWKSAEIKKDERWWKSAEIKKDERC